MELGTQILLKNSLDYLQKNDLQKAEELLTNALKSSPNQPDILRLLSVTYALRFNYPAALELIERAISLDSNNGIAHSNRGNILKELYRYEEALESLDKAIELDPTYAEAYSNKGNVLQELHRYEEALACYEKAIRLHPTYAEAYSNMGNALGMLGRHLEAMESYNKATSINPNFVDAYWHKAMDQLAAGDYRVGWENYEARWFKSHPLVFQYGNIPRLEGLSNISGKKVLVWSEQGLGDTLQFCRYIKPLSDLGCQVSFMVPRQLVSVLSSLGDYCQITDSIEACAEQFHYQTPLLSLPLLFQTTVETIPLNVPYLSFDLDKKMQFQARLKDDKNFKVGVVWNGGFRADHPELWSVNERRNIPLDSIAKLQGIPNVTFYSLQKGDPAESELKERHALIWPGIVNCVQWLNDFSDTAALIENLDLIIAVDTSTAHLAGALGKPVWILNRFDSCWRWLRGRSDSPWYPTAKIYQQSSPGDWEGALERVRIDLSELVNKHLNH